MKEKAFCFAVLIVCAAIFVFPTAVSSQDDRGGWGKTILDSDDSAVSDQTNSGDDDADSAKASPGKKKQKSYRNPAMPIFLGLHANSRDVMLGGGLGIYILPEYLVSLRLSGFGRPFKNTVFVKKAENRYYQLKESRYGLQFVLDYTFLLTNKNTGSTNVGLFFAGGVGYTSGKFAGVDMKAESKGAFVLKAGIQVGVNFYMRLGYQYFRVPEVPPNYMIFEFGVGL